MEKIRKEINYMRCAYKLGAWKAFQRGGKTGKCKPECLMEREEFGQSFGCRDYILSGRTGRVVRIISLL